MRKLLALAVLLTACHSQSKPIRMSDLDIEKVKRLEVQVQNLQLRFQNEAQPILSEHDSLVAKYCAQAGFALAECAVDTNTGVISKRIKPASQPK